MSVNCIKWIKKRKLDDTECYIWNFHRKPALLADGRMAVLNTHGRYYPLHINKCTGEFYISMKDKYYKDACLVNSENQREQLIDEIRLAEEREIELNIKLLVEIRPDKVFIEGINFNKNIEL